MESILQASGGSSYKLTHISKPKISTPNLTSYNVQCDSIVYKKYPKHHKSQIEMIYKSIFRDLSK